MDKKEQNIKVAITSFTKAKRSNFCSQDCLLRLRSILARRGFEAGITRCAPNVDVGEMFSLSYCFGLHQIRFCQTAATFSRYLSPNLRLSVKLGSALKLEITIHKIYT